MSCRDLVAEYKQEHGETFTKGKQPIKLKNENKQKVKKQKSNGTAANLIAAPAFTHEAAHTMREFLLDTSGSADPALTQSLVVSLGDGGAEMAKQSGDKKTKTKNKRQVTCTP